METQTSIDLHFLMRIHVALEPERRVSEELSLWAGRTGGWVKGPLISGEFVPPGGDWLRRMGNGTMRLDVRLAIFADDGSHILMNYLGRIVEGERNALRPPEFSRGSDSRYFLLAAVFETESKKYGWLNDIVAVGKNVPDAPGEGAYVVHDLFAAY